jgi:spermidine synthase
MSHVITPELIGTKDPSLFRLLGLTLFFSSGLMFFAEPMIAKSVLPIFGGTPMIWNGCVMAFQVTLLMGYAYAWALSRWFTVRGQILVQMVVLAAPLLVMPPTMPTRWTSSNNDPLASVVATVASSMGLPFFALSTSASVLQNWFRERAPNSSRYDPYFLYAASNLGSFLALALYPLVVEPTFSLGEQRRLWALGYLVFLIAAFGSAVLVQRQPDMEVGRAVAERTGVSSVTWRDRLRWIALSAVPSSLMLAVTTYLSTDLAPMPLLWVVPLGIYLLTFAIAFSPAGERCRIPSYRALPLVALPIVLLSATQLNMPLLTLLPLHLVALAIGALACHCELAARRPGSPFLTEFYFWVTFGGALGGFFNTLIAPALFTDLIEYPITLVLACALRPPVDRGSPAKPSNLDRATPFAVAVLTVGLCLAINRIGAFQALILPALAIPAVFAFRQSARHPQRFSLSVAAILFIGWGFGHVFSRDLYADRTFFGVYRVRTNRDAGHLMLLNGTTLHGIQAASGDRTAPLSYYHRTGPFGQAYSSELSNKSEVAVVGLGIGSLASYARPGQHWTFYEIDPADEDIARNEEFFTYLRDCGPRCSVVTGDARLSLTRADGHKYGLIVLDAFSSDAIPLHLLTKEALELYLTRLEDGGVLAFHVSNRQLSLGPVLGKLSNTLGLVALEQRDRVPQREMNSGKVSSDWVLIARDSADLGSLTRDSRWTAPAVSAATPLWTDDFSGLLSVVRFRQR